MYTPIDRSLGVLGIMAVRHNGAPFLLRESSIFK